MNPQYQPLTKKKTNLTTDYSLCNVNTDDAIKHNMALMISTNMVYTPCPLDTIIKWCQMKIKHRLQHRKA